MIHRITWQGVAVIAALSTFALVHASGIDADAAHELQIQGHILPLSEVVERAQARYPGTVLEVELEDEHGRYVYELELLDTEGTVHELYFDAASGELLEDKREE